MRVGLKRGGIGAGDTSPYQLNEPVCLYPELDFCIRRC
jgi:hypothetical protein